MPNGFWRPANRALVWLVAACFGLSPLAFHLTALALHALAAALTGLLAARLFPGWPAAPWLGAGLMASHFGAHAAALQLCNAGDALLTSAVLLALLGWERWLAKRRIGALALAGLGMLLAVTAKETAIVLPAALTLWSIARGGRWDRRTVLPLAVAWALGLAQLGVTLLLQRSLPQTYLAQARLDLAPVAVARQLADHSVCLLLPPLHVAEMPLAPLRLSHSALWLIRALVLLAGLALAVRFARRPRAARAAPLALCAAVLLLPASVLAGPPQARFLHPALPLFCLALLALIEPLRGRRRAAAFTLLAALWAVHLAGFLASPTVLRHAQAAREVESFLAAARSESVHWSDGDRVVIQNHPHPGEGIHRWPYCQQLFEIFIPGKDVTVALDTGDRSLEHGYRWEEGRLVELW